MFYVPISGILDFKQILDRLILLRGVSCIGDEHAHNLTGKEVVIGLADLALTEYKVFGLLETLAKSC
ncbi:hypothetical protein LguiB_012680 [Lonicera macranthoides]